MKHLVLAGVVFLACIMSTAQASGGMEQQHKGHGGHDMMKTKTESGSGNAQVQHVGNKTCPISGDLVKGNDYVDYKGKRYRTCCPGCDKEFLKNPEKYLKILREKGEIK